MMTVGVLGWNYLYKTLMIITKHNQQKLRFPEPLSWLTPLY